MLSALLFVGLLVYVGYTSGGLSTEASKGEEGVVYDINKVLSYYVESLNNQNTLIYSHYTQETSPDIIVTCLDCHNIETLKKLYSTCNPEILDEISGTISDSIQEICFVCHGSYDELAILTKDVNLKEFMGANPHYIQIMPIVTGEEPRWELSCTFCHIMHDEPSISSVLCQDCHEY